MTVTREQRSRRIRARLSRLLLIPRVAWLGRRTPKDLTAGWEHYWSSITSTGVGGDVLWDAGDLGELQRYLPIMQQFLDTSLPITDIWCGNARFPRHPLPLFGSVTGSALSRTTVPAPRSEPGWRDWAA